MQRLSPTLGAVVFTVLSLAFAASRAEAQSCSARMVDMKVLVIASDGTEADFPAITQALDRLGTPYTVFFTSSQPGGMTPSFLSNGCHGFFQGVIATIGNNVLSMTGAANLASYEANFGIRQVNWYTFPTADFGFAPFTAAVDTSINPINALYKPAAQPVFPYANRANPLPITFAYTYLARALNDGNTTALLADSSGNALAALHNFSDGRQYLTLVFDSNANLTHALVLSYGLINWVTKGLFLGERHASLNSQVDDILIDDAEWLPTTPCGTSVDQTGFTYRINSADLQQIINWQRAQRAQPTTANFMLTFGFNGEGATGLYNPDTLTPAVTQNEGLFQWVNHTFSHLNLDNATYTDTYSEITNNDSTADTLDLSNFSEGNLITPDISGLSNPNALQAMVDAGVRFVVSDTSRTGGNNPTFNTGIVNALQPSILEVPRHPNNLFFNVTMPTEWVAEYNCIYASTPRTYPQILDIESGFLLNYMLKDDIDLLQFHEANLRAYDGTHSLLRDLLDLAFTKYRNLMSLPVLSPTMGAIGWSMINRARYNAAGVTATIVPGQSITITVQHAAIVPVTGLHTAGAQSYGGQFISHITLNAGQSLTFPIQ